MAKKKYTFIDLFAGAGGLSEGFVRAGFTPIAHIEMDKYACDTLRTRAAFHYLKDNDKLSLYEDYLKNKKEKEDGSKLWNQVPKSVTDKIIQATIGEETIDDIFSKVDKLIGNKSIDLIVGGPPCQAYSIVGRARLGKVIEEDPRNDLYKYYVRFLQKYNPKMFVFENVMGILTAKGGGPYRHLQELVAELGYKLDAKEHIASNYGVLQKRHRYIIVGWRDKDEKGNPTNLSYPILNIQENKYTIQKDLFSDLPIRLAGEGQLCAPIEYTKDLDDMKYLKESGIRGTIAFTTQHIARPHNQNDREIYCMAIKMLQKGQRLKYTDIPEDHQKHKNKKTFLNRFQVVNPDGVSHTVVAHIAMDGHYYIYPTVNPTPENVRSITIREAARIQSFPDDYYFEGSRSAAFKQIGNAVPVIMAYKIALKIKEMF